MLLQEIKLNNDIHPLDIQRIVLSGKISNRQDITADTRVRREKYQTRSVNHISMN